MFADWYPEGAQDGPIFLDGSDLIVIGDYKIPGRSKVAGAVAAYKVDEKQAKGKSAARPSYHGMDSGKTFTIETYVWTKDQKEGYGRIALDVAPRPGSAPIPLPLRADQIAHLPITHVTVEAVTGWEENGRGWVCRMTVRPWFPSDKRGKAKPPTPTTPGRNLLAEAAAKKANPAPTSQANVCGPDGP